MLTLAVAALAVGSQILQRGQKNRGHSGQSAVSFPQRGRFVPSIYGQFEAPGVHFWDGKDRRYTVSKKIDKKQKKSLLYEPGAVWIGLGPIDRFTGIRNANGDRIWEGDVRRENYPEGYAQITIREPEGASVCRLYFGQPTQPVDPLVQRYFTNKSSFPHFAYAIFDSRFLGQSPQWGTLTFEGMMKLYEPCETLARSSAAIAALNSMEHVNPAHLMSIILGSDYPQGLGEADRVISEGLEQWGELGDSEKLACGFVASDGMSYAEIIDLFLSENGIAMPRVNGKIHFIPMRETEEDVPVLDEGFVVGEPISHKFRIGDRPKDLIYYTFNNGFRDFELSDVITRASDQYSRNGRFRFDERPLYTTYDSTTAKSFADRLSQIEMGDQEEYVVRVTREARKLLPGQKFDLPDVGRMLVIGMKHLPGTGASQLRCVKDAFSIGVLSSAQQDDGTAAPLLLDPEPDLAFTFFAHPSEANAIGVLRRRAHNQITTASVFVGTSAGVNYELVGEQTHAAGGTLLDAINSGDASPLASVRIQPDNDDMAQVLNLASDAQSYDAGRQVCVIDTGSAQEAFYLEQAIPESVDVWEPSTLYATGDRVIPTQNQTGFCYEVVSGATSATDEPDWPVVPGQTVALDGVEYRCVRFIYELLNLKRAQQGTSAITAAIGSEVFIAESSTLTALSGALTTSGQSISVKSIPQTTIAAVEFGDVTAKTGIL